VILNHEESKTESKVFDKVRLLLINIGDFMSDSSKIVEQNIKVMMRAVRTFGVIILIFGILIMFDIGGMAAWVGADGDSHKLMGMIFCIFGIIEIIVAPMFLQKKLSQSIHKKN
jgi:hypothetical protein